MVFKSDRKRTQGKKIAREFYFCSQFFITTVVVYFYEVLGRPKTIDKVLKNFSQKILKFSKVHNYLDVEIHVSLQGCVALNHLGTSAMTLNHPS